MTLSIPLLVMLSALQAPPDAGQESVLRFHDLRAAMPRVTQADIGHTVFPLVSADETESHELEAGVDLDFAAELVLRWFGSEFEYEGRSFEVLGDGRLMVRASPELQGRVARLLAELSAAAAATAEIRVDVLRLDAPPAGLGAECVVPLEAVGPLLELASREGRRESLSVRVGTGRPGLADQGRRLQLLFDHDVEVAESIYCFDPVHVQVDLGTRLAVRAAPGAGGLYLALALRRGAPLGEVREVGHTLTGGITTERGHERIAERLLHQALDVVDRSYALNTFLPDGKALVIHGRLGPAGAGSGELVIVRRAGESLAATHALSAREGGASLTLVDLSAIDPPRCISSLRDDLGDWPASIPLGPNHGWVLAHYLNAGSRDDFDAEELVWQTLSGAGLEVEGLSSWPWLAVLTPGASGARDVARLTAELAPDARVVQVGLTLREQGAEGAVLASVTLPLLARRRSSAILGVEGQLLIEADVEVAKASTVEDPIRGNTFEGLVVDVEPRLDPAGGLVLDLQGVACRLDPDIGSHVFLQATRSALEQRGSEQLLLREELRFAPSPTPGAPVRVVLGDAVGSLALVVEARW